MSLSGPPDPLLASLIELGIERKIAVVAAFDPDRPGGGFPASVPGVISVAEEFLPSLPARVYRAPGRDIPTTQPGGRWYLVNGSSFAAAHVTGLLALLREDARHRLPAAAIARSASRHRRCLRHAGHRHPRLRLPLRDRPDPRGVAGIRPRPIPLSLGGLAAVCAWPRPPRRKWRSRRSADRLSRARLFGQRRRACGARCRLPTTIRRASMSAAAAAGTIRDGEPELVGLQGNIGYAVRLTPNAVARWRRLDACSISTGLRHQRATTTTPNSTSASRLPIVAARVSYSPDYYHTDDADALCRDRRRHRAGARLVASARTPAPSPISTTQPFYLPEHAMTGGSACPGSSEPTASTSTCRAGSSTGSAYAYPAPRFAGRPHRRSSAA